MLIEKTFARAKAKAKLGWIPEITVQEMCKAKMGADLQVAQRHVLLKAKGFSVQMSTE